MPKKETIKSLTAKLNSKVSLLYKTDEALTNARLQIGNQSTEIAKLQNIICDFETQLQIKTEQLEQRQKSIELYSNGLESINQRAKNMFTHASDLLDDSFQNLGTMVNYQSVISNLSHAQPEIIDAVTIAIKQDVQHLKGVLKMNISTFKNLYVSFDDKPF